MRKKQDRRAVQIHDEGKRRERKGMEERMEGRREGGRLTGEQGVFKVLITVKRVYLRKGSENKKGTNN